MTKRPPMMGISIYRDKTLLGKAIDVTIEGNQVTIGIGVIDRFEVMRYLSPRVARDLIGEKPITDMPPLTLYCEPTCVKTSTKKKKADRRSAEQREAGPSKAETTEAVSRLTFKAETIEVIPMPGQNLSLKSFKGTLVGSIETGVEVPLEVAPATTPPVPGLGGSPRDLDYAPTILY